MAIATPEVVRAAFRRTLHRNLRRLYQYIELGYDSAIDEYNHVARIHREYCGCGLRWVTEGDK